MCLPCQTIPSQHCSFFNVVLALSISQKQKRQFVEVVAFCRVLLGCDYIYIYNLPAIVFNGRMLIKKGKRKFFYTHAHTQFTNFDFEQL